MDGLNLEIDKLFRAKEQRRVHLAAMSFIRRRTRLAANLDRHANGGRCESPI